MVWRFLCPKCEAVVLEVPASTGVIRQERKCPTCNLPILIQYAEHRAILRKVKE